MNRLSSRLLLLVGIGWLAPDALHAQQDASFAGFQFNRSLPGARSLAMGGAFVALADDATAAYSNPAGLTLLSRREVSIEGRTWSSSNPFTERGRVSGTPSNVGIDTLSGLSRRQASDRTDSLSFASYVETAPERDWALALYHHTLADFSTRFNSQGVFSGDFQVSRFGPYRFRTDLRVLDTGFAYAHQFGQCIQASGCLRLGGGLASYSLKLNTREDVLNDPSGNGAADFSSPPFATAVTTAEDSTIAGNLGLIWETTHSWRFAVAYRQGPDFRIHQNIFGSKTAADFHLPDQFVAGAAFQPTSALTLSTEIDRVLYSSLIRGNSLQNFDLHDGTETRLGMEYVFFLGDPVKPTRIAFMAGVWSDPDHRISFSKPVTMSGDLFRHAFFPTSGKRRGHVSAGLGANFGSFQMDAGCDRSSDISTCALSTVARF